jgi:6-phospho-beta-glucosidase
MRRRCPGAWLLNFTNPAGMVTEALVPVLGQRVIGICDSAGGLVSRAARAAGVALPEGRLDGVGYYGLNHLGWLYRLQSEGRDVLPELLADPAALAGFEEGRLFPPALLAGLGCLPNEYLFYYYETDKTLAAMRGAGPDPGRVHRTSAGRTVSPAGGRRAAGLCAVGGGTPVTRGGLPRGGAGRRRTSG